ncbi:MAG: hypothetical protein PHO08_15750 [Methylococcales bacterium]|nr:hypothetical protein [Methylococcales bacterium]MDD5632488.1 hypothetical protein [Methylococcales bacterium]
MTLTGKPSSLIINTPYLKPEQHWGDPQKNGCLPIVLERRRAGYEIFDTRNQTRRFIELEQVNKIRKRVDDWREAGYPGVSSVTRRLLDHWHGPWPTGVAVLLLPIGSD